MTLEQVKSILPNTENLIFKLPDGASVPEHFHVTEIGMVTKHFIDCGGIIRTEKKVNFQLWNANDIDHRLKPTKLLNIIKLSEEKLGIENAEIEVEYQGKTVEKYNLDYNGATFVLTPTFTDCLAKDNCGIPAEKIKLNLVNLETQNTCKPGGKCC
ncbi:MAG: hypothetical protein J0M08_13475 [Bacteroidetes bacterium]|nr:hypothetical protein [Bacteroidota bacterium]